MNWLLSIILVICAQVHPWHFSSVGLLMRFIPPYPDVVRYSTSMSLSWAYQNISMTSNPPLSVSSFKWNLNSSACRNSHVCRHGDRQLLPWKLHSKLQRSEIHVDWVHNSRMSFQKPLYLRDEIKGARFLHDNIP